MILQEKALRDIQYVLPARLACLSFICVFDKIEEHVAFFFTDPSSSFVLRSRSFPAACMVQPASFLQPNSSASISSNVKMSSSFFGARPCLLGDDPTAASPLLSLDPSPASPPRASVLLPSAFDRAPPGAALTCCWAHAVRRNCSSTLFSTTSRCTKVVEVCPMRWTRLTAWASAPTFST